MEYYTTTNSSYSSLSAACGWSNSSDTFHNLTKSYNQQLNDTSSLSASLIMFVVTALFFALNLFSRLSDGSAILDPKVRVGLTSGLSVFLLVMSYLFSEAKKNADDPTVTSTTELPLRARFILLWMLLVELLRKKVEEIHMYGYSGTVERGGRVLWLGSLVFTSLQGTGRKAMMGILWLLCVSKLVQRVVYTEVGKRSLALGKNARLITSYTAQVLTSDAATGDHDLRTCKYAVMEEDGLVVEAVPNGYKLKLAGRGGDVVATVGKIWELGETDRVLSCLDRDQRLRRLCLSFSLFKLLRRRFEHLPAMTAAETRSYRRTIFGACSKKDTTTTSSSTTTTRARFLTPEALFDVTKDELDFLCEYYHSVVPVALASPFFLLANYLLLPLVVFVLCFVVVVLCGNGDVGFAFRSIRSDNAFTFFGGAAQMTRCARQMLGNPVVFFCTVDFSITSLLFLMFIYEEVWEFFVFLLSDWFLVSLVCKYATRWCQLRRLQRWRRTFAWSVRGIMFARSLMHRPGTSIAQFSVLRFCGVTMPAQLPAVRLPILLPSVPVPDQVKRSVTEHLVTKSNATTGLSNGRSALAGLQYADLVPFCECDGVAEVILTWHVATSLLELEHPPPAAGQSASTSTSTSRSSVQLVATSLSKYCAYLVAFHPELLPDNQDSAERVFKAMQAELYGLLGFWGYYLSPCRGTRYRKIIAAAGEPADGGQEEEAAAPARSTSTNVVKKGAALAKMLASKAGAEEDVWGVLADLWVELVVYVAPSGDEECVEGHKNALAKGGEFVTVLWAMATHAGIRRGPAPADGDAPTPAPAVPGERSTEGITTTPDVSAV